MNKLAWKLSNNGLMVKPQKTSAKSNEQLSLLKEPRDVMSDYQTEMNELEELVNKFIKDKKRVKSLRGQIEKRGDRLNIPKQEVSTLVGNVGGHTAVSTLTSIATAADSLIGNEIGDPNLALDALVYASEHPSEVGDLKAVIKTKDAGQIRAKIE